jgi:hypothetical protein
MYFNWLYIEFKNVDENLNFQKELIKNGWSWDGGKEIKHTDKGLLLKKVGWVKIKNSDKKQIKYKRLRITSLEMVVNTLTPFVFYSPDSELIKEFLEYQTPNYENSLFPVNDLVVEDNIDTHNLADFPIGKITFDYYNNIIRNKINQRINELKTNPKWIW